MSDNFIVIVGISEIICLVCAFRLLRKQLDKVRKVKLEREQWESSWLGEQYKLIDKQAGLLRILKEASEDLMLRYSIQRTNLELAVKALDQYASRFVDDGGDFARKTLLEIRRVET